MPDKSPQTIGQILKKAAQELQPSTLTCAADINLGRLEAEILLASALRKDRVWLLTHEQDTIHTADVRRYKTLLHRRKQHEPVAYLIGEKEFYGKPLIVTKHTLIPRPETELLIDLAKHALHDAPRQTIWDIGTGSGAIALTLARLLPQASVLASDISTRALHVAQQNAEQLGIHHVTFLRSNLVQPSAAHWITRHAPQTHLLICANLPYLPESDQFTLAPDVTAFEPKRALYAGKDGLTLITRCLTQLQQQAINWNYQRLTILLEHDPPQAEKILHLAQHLFPHARCIQHKDLSERDRVLEITLTPTPS